VIRSSLDKHVGISGRGPRFAENRPPLANGSELRSINNPIDLVLPPYFDRKFVF